MKKKSLLVVILLAIVIMAMIPTSVFALSFTASMPSSMTVKESQEFIVAVKISNIDAGSNGINSLSGYLSYDTKVFDAISESSIEAVNGWTVNYSADTGKVTLLKPAFVKSEEDVFQITFRTKAGTDGKKGTISYKNIVASNSESDITASDISTTVTVSSTVNATANTTPQNSAVVLKPTNNTVKKPTVNTPTNIVPSNVTPVNNTVAVKQPENKVEEEMPYTGAEDVAVRAIFVVLVVAAISYFRYQSLKDVK